MFFSDFPGNPFWPFWALFGPLRAPGTPESDAPWPEDSIRTIFVPIRWDLTSFRAIFRFKSIPDKSRNRPRKALNRPQGGREKVAKGRPEVLERSRGRPGKVAHRAQKIALQEPPGLQYTPIVSTDLQYSTHFEFTSKVHIYSTCVQSKSTVHI